MALNGYQKGCGKRSGGVRSIALAAADDLVLASLDPLLGVYAQVELRTGARFVEYAFREGEAEYTEEATVVAGVRRIRHTIEFSLERPDTETARALGELAEESADGMIAIVTTNSGISLLVGYSEKFGTEQPLRLASSKLTTGKMPADHNADNVVLASEDDSKAVAYTGGGLS